MISCPQEEIVFTCSASNSNIVQIRWIVEFMAGSSVEIVNPAGFIITDTDMVGVGKPRMDSLGHRYTITSLSTNPTLISTLETMTAPHLNNSTVRCRESTIAGFASQSTTSLIQVTGIKVVVVVNCVCRIMFLIHGGWREFLRDIWDGFLLSCVFTCCVY